MQTRYVLRYIPAMDVSRIKAFEEENQAELAATGVDLCDLVVDPDPDPNHLAEAETEQEALEAAKTMLSGDQGEVLVLYQVPVTGSYTKWFTERRAVIRAGAAQFDWIA